MAAATAPVLVASPGHAGHGGFGGALSACAVAGRALASFSEETATSTAPPRVLSARHQGIEQPSLPPSDATSFAAPVVPFRRSSPLPVEILGYGPTQALSPSQRTTSASPPPGRRALRSGGPHVLTLSPCAGFPVEVNCAARVVVESVSSRRFLFIIRRALQAWRLTCYRTSVERRRIVFPKSPPPRLLALPAQSATPCGAYKLKEERMRTRTLALSDDSAWQTLRPGLWVTGDSPSNVGMSRVLSFHSDGTGSLDTATMVAPTASSRSLLVVAVSAWRGAARGFRARRSAYSRA